VTQMNLNLEAARTPGSPERRIDITLARLADIQESMSQEQCSQLASSPWWNMVVIVSRLRAMERAEEEVLGRPSTGLADVYDRIAQPGEHAVEAILRTFRESF